MTPPSLRDRRVRQGSNFAIDDSRSDAGLSILSINGATLDQEEEDKFDAVKIMSGWQCGRELKQAGFSPVMMNQVLVVGPTREGTHC